VRDAGNGEIVNFHCHVDASIKIADVHEKADDSRARLAAALSLHQTHDWSCEPTPASGPITFIMGSFT
jgi:hypothetical protein